LSHQSDSTNAGYRCCAWAIDLSQTKANYWLLLPIPEVQIASTHAEIQYLGYPFSISENFQMRNTHKTIAESLVTLDEILEIADKTNKKVVAYLSMVLEIHTAILGT
jgi:hydroxymethylglutaryl-CoA lyase